MTRLELILIVLVIFLVIALVVLKLREKNLIDTIKFYHGIVSRSIASEDVVEDAITSIAAAMGTDEDEIRRRLNEPETSSSEHKNILE